MIVKNQRLWNRADARLAVLGFSKKEETAWFIVYDSAVHRLIIYRRIGEIPYTIQYGIKPEDLTLPISRLGVEYSNDLIPKKLRRPIQWKIKSLGWNKSKKAPKNRYTNHLF
jgi:hypothetical protein